jgi:hypothetical protein
MSEQVLQLEEKVLELGHAITHLTQLLTFENAQTDRLAASCDHLQYLLAERSWEKDDLMATIWKMYQTAADEKDAAEKRLSEIEKYARPILSGRKAVDALPDGNDWHADAIKWWRENLRALEKIRQCKLCKGHGHLALATCPDCHGTGLAPEGEGR